MCKGANVGGSTPVALPPSMTAPALDEIKKAMPAHVWQKSLVRSLACLAFDMAMAFGMMGAFIAYLQNPFESFALHYGLSFVYWNLAGFYMWCVFVCGHDCGHGSFCDSWLLNGLFGLLSHGACLVPFYPWARSHHFHHLNHNHVDNDYSFPWITEANLDQESAMNRLFAKFAVARMAFVPVAWYVYLLAGWDGCHFFSLIPGERMWKGATRVDHFKCAISTGAVVAWACVYWLACGRDLGVLLTAVVAPVMVQGMWLLTVTYLQHHSPEVTLFDDSTWSYKAGAFETIDRTYGWVIDKLHHRISDCHVVHHIFFKGIPHYHLRDATDALEALMQKGGSTGAYKVYSTLDFFPRLLTYMYKYGFFVQRVFHLDEGEAAVTTEQTRLKAE